MPRKSRAIKVTDGNKAWNRKPEASNYRVGYRSVNKIILIVCEGQTEKLYFESFPVLGVNVKTINLKGQTKLKLVHSTKEIIDNANEEYDEVWCVFDMDKKGEVREFSDFDNAIENAKLLNYKVAYSNDAFELWFYLHFKQSETRNLRSFYFEELSKFFGFNYLKFGKQYNFCLKVYELLQNDVNSSQKSAIERAKRLYNDQKHLSYHEQNPVTKVYELVEELNRNLRK
jgi:hypothetical protein